MWQLSTKFLYSGCPFYFFIPICLFSFLSYLSIRFYELDVVQSTTMHLTQDGCLSSLELIQIQDSQKTTLHVLDVRENGILRQNQSSTS